MENRLASTTTYPELLELGPGQWGEESSTRQDQGEPSLQVWESASISGGPGSLGLSPSLSFGHAPLISVPCGALSRLVGGTWV